MKKKIEYRYCNYIARDNRLNQGFSISPVLLEGLKSVARKERRSVSWLIEDALSDYFGIRVELRKLKTMPKPAYHIRNMK